MQWIGYIGIGILVLLVLLVLVTNIQIVQQSRAYVVERLGAYSATWGVGLHFKIPFFERVVKKVSLKEQVADFDPQPVITKDNVTMQIDTVVYFQIYPVQGFRPVRVGLFYVFKFNHLCVAQLP